MEERRRHPRIQLVIHARGIIKTGADTLPFSARVLNISEGGAGLALNEYSSGRVRELAKAGADFKSSVIDMRLVSYVEDNARVTGRLAYARSEEGFIHIGVKFDQPDKDTAGILARIMELRPNVEKTSPGKIGNERHRFVSFEDFFHNLTHLTILFGKEKTFFIGDEEYMFIGMHRTDAGEVHSDCIESVSAPGKIICPDCQARIDPRTLI